jgi:hypothetical protein
MDGLVGKSYELIDRNYSVQGLIRKSSKSNRML